MDLGAGKRSPQFPGSTARCGRVSAARQDVLTIPAASFSLLLLASLMIPTGARAAPRPLRIVTINLLHGGITSELAGRGQHLEERLTMVVRVFSANTAATKRALGSFAGLASGASSRPPGVPSPSVSAFVGSVASRSSTRSVSPSPSWSAHKSQTGMRTSRRLSV